MEHKAFAFDWRTFQRQLAPILRDALSTNSVVGLATFIEQHRHSLTDPYEGERLPDDWQSLMECGDVHEHGDFALTLYYSPRADRGIGGQWLAFSDGFQAMPALLGESFGPADNLFDPGRMGSYFQSPDVVSSSLRYLSTDTRPELTGFIDLLKRCGEERMGVYVTC